MRIRALASGIAFCAALLPPAAAGAQEVPITSLAQAVAWALERNPSAVVALEEVRRAQALVEETRSASLPTLVGTAALTQLDAARQAGGIVSQPQTGLLLEATLAVPIVVPRSWAQWSQSKQLLRASEASSADVRRVVAVGVARAYLAIVAQKRVIEAASRARDTDKAHFDFAHQRYVGGVGNRIDEVRAQQQLASDEANVEVQLTMLAREREVLGVLVGVGGPLDAEEPNLQASHDASRAIDEADRRSDVQAGQARLKATEHVVHDDWTEYSPYLTGSFSPFFADPATILYPTTGWQAQLVLTVPFYDGGLRYAQHKERAAARHEAQTQLEARLRQARSEVRTAFEELRHADAALDAARRASDLARRGLDLAQIAYRAGATTNLEVIDAERTARDSETAVAVAEDGARQARLDLLAATGMFP
jgi:outer membrane protein TolC